VGEERRSTRFGAVSGHRLKFRAVPVLAASSDRGRTPGRHHADVAQLVAHNLAKVGVAGSNPVVRSVDAIGVPQAGQPVPGGVAERRGNGLQSRVHGFKSRLHLVAGLARFAARG
jgi:hypothetical protein